MTLEDAYSLHAGLLGRLPAKYPKPRLVIHESPEALVEFMGDKRHEFHVANGYHPTLVMAMADPERNAIHLPYSTLRDTDEVILNVLLHEFGHLYYAQTFGVGSPEFNSEAKADAFARRWTKRIIKSGAKRGAK